MTSRPTVKLTPADIVRLTHPDNWLGHPATPRRFHRMMAAVVVLLAVYGLSLYEISRIRFRDYRRGPRATLLVRGRNRDRTIPVVPEVAAVLEALMGSEGINTGARAFTNSSGRACDGSYLGAALIRAGERLGFQGYDLVEMIQKPARGRLLKRDNPTAEVLLGFLAHRRGVGPDRLRKLVHDCNPLKGLGRELVTAPATIAYIVGAEQELTPISSDEDEYAHGMKLPAHPDIDAMIRAVWPKFHWHMYRKYRLEHFPGIYPLIMLGLVSTAQIAPLYRTSTATIEKWVETFPKQYDGTTYRLTVPQRLPEGAGEAIEQICADNPDFGAIRIVRALEEKGIEATVNCVHNYMGRKGLNPDRQRPRRFDAQCAAVVRDVSERRGPIGAAAMSKELRRAGIKINIGTVRRNMQQLGLLGGIDADAWPNQG